MASLINAWTPDATQDGRLLNGNAAFATNCSYDNTVNFDGLGSLKHVTNNPAVEATVQTTGINYMADTGTRLSFWFRIDALPSSLGQMFEGRTTGGSAVWRFGVNADGTTTLSPVGATAATGTAVVAINTWTRASISFTITNTTTYRIDWFLNGVLQGSCTAGTLTRVGAAIIQTRHIGSVYGTDKSLWITHIVSDDGTDYADIGDLRCTAKRPIANNTNNFDTFQGANPANRWENVYERPSGITNGWKHVAATDVQENYTLEAAAVGDRDITGNRIIGRRAWILAGAIVGGAGTPQIMDNGTESAIVLIAGNKIFSVVTTSSTYPSNAAGIGMRSTNDADDCLLWECGTIIVYDGATYSGRGVGRGIGRGVYR